MPGLRAGLHDEFERAPGFAARCADGFRVVAGQGLDVQAHPVDTAERGLEAPRIDARGVESDHESFGLDARHGVEDRLLAQCLSTCEDDAVEQPPPARQQVFDVAPRDCAGDRRVEDRRILAVGAAQGAALAEDRRDEAPGPVDGGQRDEPGDRKVLSRDDPFRSPHR
jgi:hypothetical protein